MADVNQQLSNLDPKLKEAYERVMGTSTTPSTASPSTPISSIHTSQQPAQPASSRSVNVGPTLQPVGARREPERIQIGGTVGTQTHGYVATKKKKGLPLPFLILGGIVFLIVYTIFWLKFFNVPVPYLP